jgi:hypothetical protein
VNLSTENLSVNGNTPLFSTFTNSASKTGIVMTSTKGEVYYWIDCAINSWIHYQMPLLSQHEQITVVHPVNENQVLLGSSTGEIYLLHIRGPIITASTFYKHTGISSYIIGMFSKKSLPHLSEVIKPNTAESILSINTIGNDAYFVSSKYIALWNITSPDSVEVL